MKVQLSSTPRYVQPEMPDSPVAIPELGAAYFVRNVVSAVEPGGPAANAKLQPGDRLTSVKIRAAASGRRERIAKEIRR